MASSDYGVTSTGFIRQTEAEIVAEISSCFPDSDFVKGDWDTNFLEAMTKIRTKWQESGECNFNAQNNYCIATGCALDSELEFMGYVRLDGENDADAIARVKALEQKSDGAGYEAILERKLLQLDGVCRVRIYLPRDRVKTGHGPCDYEVVVEGGDKEEISAVILGCSSALTDVGSTLCRIEDADGICRDINFTPATVTNYCVRAFVRTFDTNCGGCSGQTFESIKQSIFDVINSKGCTGVGIGGTIRGGMIQIPGVEISKIQFAPVLVDDDGNCICNEHDESAWIDGPLALECRQVMNVETVDCICVVAFPGSV